MSANDINEYVEDSDSDNHISEVQVDTAHPRFKERYYCPSCKSWFEQSSVGLKFHFKSEVHKTPYGECAECSDPIYLYQNHRKTKTFQYYECGHSNSNTAHLKNDAVISSAALREPEVPAQVLPEVPAQVLPEVVDLKRKSQEPLDYTNIEKPQLEEIDQNQQITLKKSKKTEHNKNVEMPE